MSASNSSPTYSLWLNGESASELTLNDRAIQYGDGFFTTISVVNNKVHNWQAHWRRIVQSSVALGMPTPEEKTLRIWLYSALSFYFQEHQTTDCVLKMIMTRGVGGVGYQPPKQVQPNILFYIKTHPLASSGERIETPNINACLCKTRASTTCLAGVKTLNRLENVLARSEAAEQGCDEGVMLDFEGRVVSGTQSNLYLIKGEQVLTPKLEYSGVEGTTFYQLNQVLVDSAWTLLEREINLQDLESADELFFTNAVRGVQPVRQFQGQGMTINKALEIQQIWDDWQIRNGLAISEFKGDL